MYENSLVFKISKFDDVTFQIGMSNWKSLYWLWLITRSIITSQFLITAIAATTLLYYRSSFTRISETFRLLFEMFYLMKLAYSFTILLSSISDQNASCYECWAILIAKFRGCQKNTPHFKRIWNISVRMIANLYFEIDF